MNIEIKITDTDSPDTAICGEYTNVGDSISLPEVLSHIEELATHVMFELESDKYTIG